MKHKNFGPECKIRVSNPIKLLGPRQKMSQFAPTFFWTFYQFSVSLPLTFEYSKKFVVAFFCFGKIWPILTLDMVKNWKFWINDCLIKKNDSCFMVKVIFLYFWLCLNSKWAKSCQNGKLPGQFLLNIQ